MRHEPFAWRDTADIPPRDPGDPWADLDAPALHGSVPPLGPRNYPRDGGLPDLTYLALADLAKRPVPPREWAVGNMMPLYKATMLTGKGGVGKSLLAQMLCTCTALGRPFLGMETVEMPALYMSWEDDHDELWRRQAAICNALGVGLGDMGDWLALVSMADQSDPTLFAIGEGGRGAPTKRGEQVAEEIDGIGGLFVFDNASQIYSGDHDKLGEVAQLAHWLNRLATPNVHSINRGPRAGLLLHHPNKAGADWLGSVAYENQFRSRLYMDRPDTPDRDMRRLSNPKANYAATGGEVLFRWHEGSFIRDEELPDDRRAELAAVARDGGDNDLFLTCLAERTRQERGVSEKRSPNYAPTVFATMSESRGIGKDRLAAAMDRLFRTGAIERGTLPWKHDRKPVEGLILCADDDRE
jgi:RecA-family ATPase